MNIYVGNLSQQTSEEQLRDLFAEYGDVDTVKVIIDNFTGHPKGFAFVEMGNTEEAEKAVESLNGTKVGSNSIVVNEARPKTSQSNYGSNRSGGGNNSFRSNNNNSRRY